MYRLQSAGEYFVGVYGLNLTSKLPFTISATVQQNRFSTQEEFESAGRDPWVSYSTKSVYSDYREEIQLGVDF